MFYDNDFLVQFTFEKKHAQTKDGDVGLLFCELKYRSSSR